MNIRPARPEDVPGILFLVNEHARRGDLLPRTAASIRDTLDDVQRKTWDTEIDALQSARRVTLWTLKDGKPSAVTVRAGVSDSTHTEVLGGGIEPDTEVIIGAGGP